jgi:hypothetical protein
MMVDVVFALHSSFVHGDMSSFFGILASVIIKMFLREASGVSEIVKSDLQLNVLVFLISGS